MNAAAVILAAGASRRMGCVKALLPYQGETFLGRLVRVLKTCCDPVIVVVGHHAAVVRPEAERVSALVAENPGPERGMLSSLQCGLQVLPADIEAFSFIPVDHPALQPSTVNGLHAALVDDPAALFAIPRFEGRRGHPVVCRAPLAAEFLNLPVTATAKDVVHRYEDCITYLDCDDPGVLHDIDDPQAYERLLATL